MENDVFAGSAEDLYTFYISFDLLLTFGGDGVQTCPTSVGQLESFGCGLFLNDCASSCHSYPTSPKSCLHITMFACP